MKRIVLLLALTACCNAQTGGANAAPHRVEILESQSGQTVDVHKGDDVVVTFVASSGTGYEWQMEPTALATVKEEDVPQQPGLPGGPVKMMFHVQAKGTVTLHFKFFRPWEKTTPPTKTFSATLKVSE